MSIQAIDRRIRGGLVIAALGVASATAAACGVTTQQEVQMGAQEASQVNSQLPIVTDPQLNSYINALGRELAAQGPRRDIPWHFYIVNTDVVNAMSLPGGFVYINRGIVTHASSMAELAGVVAHEIGHVEERHSVQQLERAQGANTALTLAYVLMGRQPSGIEQAGIQVGGAVMFARFDRTAESQADADAVTLTTRAGISPQGLPSFFNKLMQMRQGNPSLVAQWFNTHPTEEQRIAATQQEINRIPRSTLSRLRWDSNAFQSFKARMARYPSPPAQYRAR